MSPPVQELPTAYKLVHAYCLPLRGRLGHVPALHWLFRLSWCVFRVWIARELAPVVAQPFATKERYGCGVPLAGIAGAIPRRNPQLRTNLFIPTLCRLRGRHAEVVSAAVRDEGALRMRHTPCGCVPYGRRTHTPRRVRTRKGYALRM